MKGYKLAEAAFTLLELLMTVVVVSILAVLLMAGFGRTKGLADSARCAENLRQIAVLMNSYAANHNGWYPRDAHAKGYKGGGVRYAPEHFLLDYDGFTKGADGKFIQEAQPAPNSIFRCPGETSERDSRDRIWYQSHYGFNLYLVHSKQEEMIAAGSTPGTNPYRRPLTAIANPSKVFLAGDARLRYNINAQTGDNRALAFRHGSAETCNVVFVDGHVETLPNSALKFTKGGPAAFAWDQYIEWGGEKRTDGSLR